MRAFAELAVEAVAIQQGHEQLEVFFLAVVRRGRHQQEVARQAAQQLAELETRGFVDLAAEVAGRHLVGFVHDDQVPLGLGQQLLVILVARKLVEPRDQAVLLTEVVAALTLLLLFAAEQFEIEAELFTQFVLPLFGQGAGRDDQHAAGVGAQHQLPDQQPGHDGLAGAGIVGQHKAQRLARQHGLVHCRNLVRQGLYVRGVHRHQGVEQVRQTDAIGLQRQAETGRIGVKCPCAALCGQAQAVLVAAKKGLFIELALGGAIRHHAGIGADVIDVDQPHDLAGHQAFNLRVFGEFFELDHAG